MSSYLALLLCTAFVVWLYRRDFLDDPPAAGALWIPTLWLLIKSSRPLSLWLHGGTIVDGEADYLEGSPVDRIFFLGLIAAAYIVLRRRRIDFTGIFANNMALTLLFLYLGCSVLWSDYPFVAFKRWFKEAGSVLVVLVLLTDPSPTQAISTVFRRCADILLPLSVVLIKYFPDLGRGYSISGFQMVTGVTMQKNALGMICVTYGLISLWDLLERWQSRRGGETSDLLPPVARIAFAACLLVQSDSNTSIISAVIGSVILLSGKVPLLAKRPRILLLASMALVPLALTAVTMSSMLNPFIEAMGRDSSLTGRTRIWDLVLSQGSNPLFGTGFYTFWLGATGVAVWDELPGLNTAHSGYIEIYLDGGMIAVMLMVAMWISAGRYISKRTNENDGLCKLQLAFFTAFLVSNFSESYIFRLNVLWFTFLTMILRLPTVSDKTPTPLLPKEVS